MAEDAVKVAPHAYKVVVENSRVRVLENQMKPGDKTALHSHPDLVAVAVSGGKFRFTSPDGQSMEIELEDGQAMFVEATEHSTENVGTDEPHVFLVELK